MLKAPHNLIGFVWAAAVRAIKLPVHDARLFIISAPIIRSSWEADLCNCKPWKSLSSIYPYCEVGQKIRWGLLWRSMDLIMNDRCSVHRSRILKRRKGESNESWKEVRAGLTFLDTHLCLVVVAASINLVRNGCLLSRLYGPRHQPRVCLTRPRLEE